MANPHRRGTRGRNSATFRVWTAGGVLALALVAGFAWLAGGSGDESGAAPKPSGPDAVQEPLLVEGVEVIGPWVDLGHVPLDTPVQHIYTLRNAGSVPVTLGEASIKVLEGC